MKKVKAFILAAGLGERLRPITDHLPKPLIPILGKPVIERVVERIAALPVRRIGINLHYKPGMIRDWAAASPYRDSIEFFYEETILGTGGAIKNAERFLQGSFFIVHNSDILSDISLETLIDRHFSEGNAATLAVHDYQEFNHVWLDERGGLQFVGKAGAGKEGLRNVAFTGIALYSPEFLPLLPAGKSSIVDAWLKAVSSGLRVGTVDFTGCRWGDVGTPEALSSCVFDALREEGETIFVHASVDCSGARLGGRAVIEKGSMIDEEVSLRNCILLPGAWARKGAHIENAIIGPDYRIDLKEQLGIPSCLPAGMIAEVLGAFSGELAMTLIGTGGSDRKYFRIRDGEKKAVLMECPETDPDYQRHMTYTHFFRRYSLPVPELLWSGERHSGTVSQRGSIYGLFEDLGDVSLYSWLKCERESGAMESLYKSVMDILIKLHTAVSIHASECLLLHSRMFDYGHLRWETDYFIERFVTGVKGLRIADAELLNGEFDRLARKVDSFWKTVVHRDFQSQNIMVTYGDIPRLIDYQGARMGPPAYDLVSILWDPYFVLDESLRVLLLDYYIEGMKKFYGSAFDETAFRETILPCRLQRHMQALGAYGFLSKVKGRAYFRRYVPQALRYLKEEVEEAKDEYPALRECVRGLDEKAEN